MKLLHSLTIAALCVRASAWQLQPARQGSLGGRSVLGRVHKVRGGAASGDAAVEMSLLGSIGAWYAASIAASPVITKSVTSGVIFAAADATAQSIAPPASGRQTKQTILNALVGLCYMGPAAHYWYATITKIFPLVTLKYVLIKALCGQLLFGPVFTCVFFAATCAGNNQGIGTFTRMVRNDLLPTLRNGLMYWPCVDLISYSLIPVDYIPLFVNVASFIWTIYLACKAAAATRR